MKTLLKILAAGFLLAAITCTEKGSEPEGVSAKTCGICHKLPPMDSNHTLYLSAANKNLACATCHQGYSADSATNSFYVNATTHMDGIIEGSYIPSRNTCNLCHEVPPTDPQHAFHIDTQHYQCSYCHLGYSADTATGNFSVNAATHMNGNTDVIFSLPWSDSGKAAYDVGTKQCSNVYCHGGIPQGTHATVSWVGGSPINLRCYACHDSAGIATYHYGHAKLALLTGTAPHGGTVQQCNKCHDAAYSVPLKTIDSLKHINGVYDRATCKTCHLTWTTWEEYVAGHPGATPFGKIIANRAPVSMP